MIAEQDEDYISCTYGVIESGELGNCFGIGIYCPDPKRGYMMHHADPDVKNTLQRMIKAAKGDCNDVKSLIIRVTGGYTFKEDEFYDQIDGCRKSVMKTLSLSFQKNQFKIKWNRQPDCIELSLDIDSGVFELWNMDKSQKF